MHFGTFPLLTGTPDALAAELKNSPELRIWPLEIGKAVGWQRDALAR